ncbi:MAG TPA: DNA (cytosine-5-)-methyltransferase [Chryseosolibacter sp.]
MSRKKKKLSIRDFAVADLFCGVGGLTHGFVLENFEVSVGIDFDKSCEYAFESNNRSKFVHKDITTLTASELSSYYPKNKKKILVGCAPCQPFSSYNKKSEDVTVAQKEDTKWKLLYSFSRLIEKLNPDIVSMENVPLLVTFNKGKVFNDFVKSLEKRGYSVSWQIVNAQDYAVPQRRKRLILLASKLGEISLIAKTVKNNDYKTVREAIGFLPPVEDGTTHPSDRLHRASKLSELNKKRIIAMKEGGFWRDWDKSLWLKCHKKKSGKNFLSVYGRMKWDDVAPTMTTYCTGLSNGRFGHPDQNRAITLREAALLQSFPRNYEFFHPQEPISTPRAARHIGNAVPVKLGVAIAKSIKRHIESFG